MTLLTITAITLLTIGLIFFVTALRRVRKLALASAIGHSGFSIVFLTTGALFAAIGMNLYSYERLSYEAPVAYLNLSQKGGKQFVVEITFPVGTAQKFELVGDEWQVDARIVKWKPSGNLLGLNTKYRLERIRGRYRNTEDEINLRPSVFALSKNPGFDFFNFANEYPKWTPWLDTINGNSTFMPMVDRARYKVVITQSGLITHAENAEAREAISAWK